MSARPATVGPDDPVSTAVERMTRFGFNALPVVSGSSRLVGVVSLLDVLRFREEYPQESADGDARVGDIMTVDVLAMPTTAKVAAVAQRMRSHGELRMLPVVQGGRLVGVVTRSDLLRSARSRPTGLRRLVGGRHEQDALLGLARERRVGPAPDADTPVTAFMTREVVSVRSADSVTWAVELMLQHRHSGLPVAEDGVLVGFVSEADVLADPQAGRAAHATVGRVMTRTPITLPASATAGEARTLVADHGLRLVPIVDGAVLVGVLSRSDLV